MRMNHIATIDARVAGIPCQIGVLRFDAPSVYGWANIDWQLLDRRGRPAAWLERKLDNAARREVEQAVFSYMQ